MDEEWTTILVCGQGRGQGSIEAGGTTGNFYFALDITDPENPKPLWEFTHDRMGETWSVPVIGKISKDGDTWAAFVGSGYDNVEGQGDQGNVFYAVDLETGESFWNFEAAQVDTSPLYFTDITNAFPSAPSLIDTDSDGYVDRVYIGDLEGRMWKVDVSWNFVDQDSWNEEAIYTDSMNYPILTKPALWINPIATDPVPYLYFGTGGDDYARPDTFYSFIALIDGAAPEVDWYLGDQETLGLAAEKDKGDFDEGEKVWADPKVADYVVYFSTLIGSIESVDPCENIAGEGKLYARWIQAVTGTPVGGTALKGASGPTESLNLAIKTRAAVTLGERDRTTPSGTRKREVYIQEYDSTLQRLEQGVISLLKVKSIREIYRVIR
jgi:Tfp pilus tip-associated adhesin PilY1